MRKKNTLKEELKAIGILLLWIISIFAGLMLFLSFTYSFLTDASAQTLIQEHLTEDERVEQKFAAWKEQCSKCHGSGDVATEYGISVGAPKDLFNAASSKEVKDIDSYIRRGHKNLPPFEQILTAEEIEILARYIKLGSVLQRMHEKSEDMDVKPLLEEEIIIR